MRIEIIFDTICPWSYLALGRLGVALDERPQGNLNLVLSPFLLNPHLPPEGLERGRYLKAKFGGSERLRRSMEKLSLLGAGVGINFDFQAIRKTPNTVDSHRLIRHADREGQGESAVEALFAAYFTQGRDIGDRDVLAAIAREIGLDGEAVRAHLAGSGDVAEVHACYARTRRLGIKGVPSFIFDEQFSLSGAQEPAIFQRLFEIAEEARQGQQQADAVRAM